MNDLNLTVDSSQDGLRADKFLVANFPEVSRTKLQKLFDNDQVTIDGEPIAKSRVLAAGEELELPHPDTLEKPLAAKEVKFDVLYEDRSFMAINKAPGIAVHPVSDSDEQTTIANGVLAYLGEKARAIGSPERPCIVHRLDKETSGVLLIAKTAKAYEGLKAIFANRQIVKEYLAIVRGAPDLLAGSCVEPIARHPKNPLRMQVVEEGLGRESRTDWERVSVDEKENIGLVRCTLHTGRTHQARVHLSHLGHPVLGDKAYGYRGSFTGRVLLHAQRVELPHPISGKTVEIEAPIPKDFLVFKKLFAKG